MWRNSSSAFPVGSQSCGPRSCRLGSAGCLDLVAWLKSSSLSWLGGKCTSKVVRSILVHFWVRGGKNEVLADFTKLIIFMTEMIYEEWECSEGRAEKTEKWNHLFEVMSHLWQFSAQITDLWKSIRFSIQICKFVNCSNRWVLHMEWVLWVSWMNPESKNDQD